MLVAAAIAGDRRTPAARWTSISTTSSASCSHAPPGLRRPKLHRVLLQHFTNTENDGRKLQDFLMVMETTIRDHPLGLHSSNEEIDGAIELAAKELQKINDFRAPREKLLCVISWYRVINNLLLNLSMPSNHVPAGADDFLPSFIYVIVKANPPRLHCNPKFIQLLRRQSKLEYYLTISFIRDISVNSLSMEQSEFQKHMQAAKSVTEGVVIGVYVLGPPEGTVP